MYVAPGSQLTLLSGVSQADFEAFLLEGGLKLGDLKNLTVNHVQGSIVMRRDLELLPLEDYDSILILADRCEYQDKTITMRTADSRSLACLLLIRDILVRYYEARVGKACFGKRVLLLRVLCLDALELTLVCPQSPRVLDSRNRQSAIRTETP